MSELPETNRAEALRWLASAREDMTAMRVLERDPSVPPRMVCFLAHLVVEKSLKATLIDAEVPFAKTHDLLSLHEMCRGVDRLWNLNRAFLAELNPWSVAGRYVDDLVEADRASAERLGAFAEEVVAAVEAELGGGDGRL